MKLNTNPYKGVIVPMVTPLNQNQTVDVASAKLLVDEVVSSGAAPFVLGSTGEGVSLSMEQKQVMVKSTVEATKGRALIYAGVTSNSQSTALEEANIFASLGVDVLVVTLPFYYPIDELQMLRFFQELADALPLPLIIYNMPGMVKQSIPLELVNQLSEHHNIVGLKDSERDTDRMMEAIALWGYRSDFAYLLGWAAMSVNALQQGADGIVPSTGNLCSGWYVELLENVNKDLKRSQYLQELTDKVSAIYQHNKNLSQSIPALKCMLSLQGKCQLYVAPPLFRMNETEEKNFLQTTIIKMKEVGL